MKTKDISKVMDTFLVSENEKAIFIHGEWGIGKTYNVNKYLKDKKHIKKDLKVKLKYVYSSLFGKQTLDEIHTEICNKMFNASSRKVKNGFIKFYNSLNNVVKGFTKMLPLPVHRWIPELPNVEIKDENPKINASKMEEKQIKVKKKQKVDLIILDDFERKNSNISSDDLMGYVHNLIIQGVKVLILGDVSSSMEQYKSAYLIEDVSPANVISKNRVKQKVSKVNYERDVLGDYKEKVLDKFYTINESPVDVMKEILKNDNIYLTDKIVEDLKNNLRTLIKAHNLFKLVKEYIRKFDVSDFDFQTAFMICVYVVIEILSNTNIEKCYKENEIVSLVQKHNIGIEDNLMIIAIFKVYTQMNFETLEALFDKEEKVTIYKPMLFMSDMQKIEMANKEYAYAISVTIKNETNNTMINQFIKDWCKFDLFKEIKDYNEDKLFNKLFQDKCYFTSYDEENQKFIKFYERYKKFSDEQKLIMIENSLKDGNIDNIANLSFSLKHNQFTEEYKKRIEQKLVENNFYLLDLSGDIDETMWNFNHLICGMVSSYFPKQKDKLYRLLNKIKDEHIEDKSCRYRIEQLINQYNLKKPKVKKKKETN